MRFGKRNRNPIAMGWRGKPQSGDSEFSPVASEERDALLAISPGPPEDAAEPEDPTFGNATQRLSIALGRFERQVAKAREGAPQEVWSDECMTQLISAVEIALSEGWDEVVEALTETGRILQSYEDVGQAHLAVSFLCESYEALCVMMGDLLLGKVRAGVVQKWRNRYRLALEELKNAGIPLVRDEDEPGARAAWTPRSPAEPASLPAREVPEPRQPLAPPATTFTLQFGTQTEPPVLSELIFPEDEEDNAPAVEASHDDETDDMESESPAHSVARSFDSDTLPSAMDALPPLAPLGSGFLDTRDSESPSNGGPSGQSTSPETGATSPEVIERLDTLCEYLSVMERDPQADRDMAFYAIADSVDFLDKHARGLERTGCVCLCESMTRMCNAAEKRPVALDDKFFELAYAFCGVYVEADDGPGNPMIRSWVQECEGLLAGWMDIPSIVATEPAEVDAKPDDEERPAFIETDEAVETEIGVDPMREVEAVAVEAATEEVSVVEELFDEPAPPEMIHAIGALNEIATEPETLYEAPATEQHEEDETKQALTEESADMAVPYVEQELTMEPAIETVDDNSPETLLFVAQQAMSSGRAADAKRLALQAAAMLARLEVDEASKRVGEAEQRLRQGADLIEQARLEVQRAEQRVAEAAKLVVEGEANTAQRRALTAGVSQKLGEVEARVAELDEEIRQLQARRDNEARMMADTRNELHDARTQETLAEADMGTLQSLEEDARVCLEDTRQRVKTLQRKRTEVEAAMERARELLTRQRLSMVDIQQTLAQVGGRSAEAEPEAEGDLLF